MAKKLGRPRIDDGPSTTRIDLVKAAARVVGLYGADKASLRLVASHAKVSLATLQHYFPKKILLWKATIDELVVPVEAQKNEASEIKDLIKFILENRIKNLSKSPGYSAKILLENDSSKDSLLAYLAEVLHESRQVTREKIEDAIESGELRNADRDQLVIDLRLPEGTDYGATKKLSEKIVSEIKKTKLWKKEIKNIANYTGTSTPKFYYNLNLLPSSPHLAQMLVTIDSFNNSPYVRNELDKLIQPLVNDGVVLVRELEQGPPVEAAVIVKVFGEDFEKQIRFSEKIRNFLTDMKETSGVRTQIGAGNTAIRFNINDTNALKFGVARTEATTVLLGRSRGVPASKYRIDDDPVNIVIKSGEGEDIPLESLKNSAIVQTKNDVLKLNDLGNVTIESNPSVITHENGKQVVKIYVELAKGYGYNEILAKLNPFLKTLETPEGLSVELGGQDKESKESNSELKKGAPVALALLVFFLLIQFNSFRKSLIVFSSVPLSFVGISPSHIINGFPFGFFSLLGALALIGIIVNNAILIIEFIDAKLAETDDLELSILEALRMRLKPILFTTATTIIGLLPLAFGDATLWPPFAYTIIFGLIMGSTLAVFFVPAFYNVLYRKSGIDVKKSVSTVVIAFICLLPSPNKANTISLRDVLKQSDKSNIVIQAKKDKDISQASYQAQWRSAFLPKLGLKFEQENLNEDLVLQTPIGEVNFQNQSTFQGGVVLSQNVLDAPEMIGKLNAANNHREAYNLLEKRSLESAQYYNAMIYLSNLEIEIKMNSSKNSLKT